jgi:FtsP/CotA-like multicopper oxidase with cupredoxin domain
MIVDIVKRGAIGAALVALASPTLPAAAQTPALAPTSPVVPCPDPSSQPLIMPPEIVRDARDNVLRGTIVLSEEFQRFPTSTKGKNVTCAPQIVRMFRADPSPATPPARPPAQGMNDPIPGPTLRARVGDLVQLRFFNEVNSNRFDRNIDIDACTTVGPPGPNQIYPAGAGDVPPNCLHASSTANIHFHGTHTNPNSTGDNVFLQIRPLPRDNQGNFTTTAQQASVGFDDFFKSCADKIKQKPLYEWPMTWEDMPQDWVNKQTELLMAYERQNPTQPLWTIDRTQLVDGWPQYYIGAVPYCFALPTYTAQTWPPPPGSDSPIMGQSPGTHWYHAHKHGSTAINVANGMVGAFIIEGQYDDDLNTFYGQGWARTQPVLVINQLGVQPNLKRTGGGGGGGSTPGRNDKGPDFSVNGRTQPVVTMAPGEVQLWRIVNGSGRSGMFLGGFPPAFNFRQLAQDGVQFADENYKASQNRSILLAAGNRADLLVQAPVTPGVYPLLVQHEVDPSDLPTARPVVLLQIRVPDGVPPVTGPRSQFITTAPKQPDFLKNIADTEVQGTRTVNFATPVGPLFSSHMINGHKFGDGEQKPLPVTLNTVEEWKIMNFTFPAATTAISHPFHIHLNPFQIVEIFDPNQTVNSPNLGPLPKYVPYAQVQDFSVQCGIDPKQESTWFDCHNPIDMGKPQVWWDVFPIPAGNTYGTDNVPGFFRMRSRFVDFPGQYVIHCHILAHEDRGMMLQVDLAVNEKVPLAHH